MSFELVILGSSSALPTSKRFPTAHLLNVNERFFLIDCGEGTQMQLRKFNFSLARINHILISHLHGDHVFGLFGLLSSLGLMGRHAPINLYGPEGLRVLLTDHLKYFGPLPFEIVYHLPDEETGLIYESKSLTINAVRLDHRTATFGFVFREKPRLLNIRKEKIQELGLGIAELIRIKNGEDYQSPDGRRIPNSELTMAPYHQRSYAYISDTRFYPPVVEHIRNVDLLFHEATFAEKDSKLAFENWHSTARQAAEIARQAEVKKLLIGHFSSRYRDIDILVEEAREVFENTYGVNDGDRFTLPLHRIDPD